METYELKDMPIEKKYYCIKKVSDLIPGDITLHPIYREDGLLLVSRYTVLQTMLIIQTKIHINTEMPLIVANTGEQLRAFLDNRVYSSIEFVQDLETVINMFKEDFKLPVSIDSYIDERVNLTILTGSKRSHKLEDSNVDELVRRIFVSPLWNSFEKRLESERLQQRAMETKGKIAGLLSEDKCLQSLLKEMKEYDDILVRNGINLLCISVLIGLTLELSEDELLDIAISALFCNIGYLKVNKRVFKDFLVHKNYDETIKSHVRNTLEILSRCTFCRDKKIIYGIVEHHEYYNGKGFPNGKRGNNITLFGRILTIASEYEDYVGSYFDESGITSNDAVNMIFENADMKFDPHILSAFVHRTNIYKIGQVLMFDKYGKGQIVGFSNFAEAPFKPIVKFENGYIKDFYEI